MSLRRATGLDVVALAAWASAFVIVALFMWIVGDVLVRGARHVSWQFLAGAPVDAGRAGGILPVLVANGMILLVALVVAVPVSVGAAVFLAEFATIEGRISKIVGRSLDVLSSVPSIVFGLFGSAFFCRALGLGFSILAGGLTLGCMVLPILIRTMEQGLRAVPQELRLEAASLGMSAAGTVTRIILPTAAPALVAALVLGMSRALAETAALLFTSGYVDRMPESIFDSGRALSIHIFDLSMNVAGGDDKAAASAVVLLAFVVLLDALGAILSLRWRQNRAV